MTKRILFVLLVLLSFSGTAQSEYDFELSKSLDIYAELLQKLNLNYVDPLEPARLNQAAIEAALKELDPYTVYYPESQMEDVAFMHSGKYGGIGANVIIRNDSIFVNKILKDSPFDKAGIHSGDLLLKIDKEELFGKTQEDMSELLQGSAGSSFDLNVYRPKDKSTFKKSITREEIQIDNVSYASWVDKGVAYVKLDQFKKDAARDIKVALDSLSKSGKAESIIIDLRANPGGLLIEAVNIVNLFVPANQEVVSTKGKVQQRNQVYKTSSLPSYPNVRVAVLINGRSASASEIVAGGLQDMDRAVVIGQKSFGKGLVQNVMPLSYHAQVKITTAKYYIPSGRCIQAIDYSHKKNGKAERIPDSLFTTYYTRAGRPVKDAGGIIPDIKLEEPKLSEITQQLLSEYYIYDFCNEVAYSGKNLSYSNTVDQQLLDDFQAFLTRKGFRYESEAYTHWKKLKEACSNSEIESAVAPSLDAIEKQLSEDGQKELQRNKEEIYQILVAEIMQRTAYQKGRVKAQLTFDKELQEAIKVVSDETAYTQLLKAEK